MVTMKIEQMSERENGLLKRKEYWLSVDHHGKRTPAAHEILHDVAKKLGSGEDNTVIGKILTEKGKTVSRIRVYVYLDKKEIPESKTVRLQRKKKKFMEKHGMKEPQPEAATEAAVEAPVKVAREVPTEAAEEAAEEDGGEE